MQIALNAEWPKGTFGLGLDSTTPEPKTPWEATCGTGPCQRLGFQCIVRDTVCLLRETRIYTTK
jgi:hypothetical protein